MGEYIGKLSIDNAPEVPVGSTLYGECSIAANVAAKVIPTTDTQLGANFGTLLDGVTVHIKFVNGNSVEWSAAEVENRLTLKIGSTLAKPIVCPGGSCICQPGAITSFTFDGNNWVVNDATATALNVKQTYASTDTDAISGAGVAAALGTLDVNNISGFGAGKTLATLSETDGKIAATFQDITVDWADQIDNKPNLGDAAGKDVITSIVDSGAGMNKNSTDLPTTQAVANYVAGKIAGLTGVMHFIGSTTTAISDGNTSSVIMVNGADYTVKSGDVVLSGDNKEFVWTGAKWELLGDEGSYALKSSTDSVVKSVSLSGGTFPTVNIENVTVPNVTNVGKMPTLSTKNTTIPNVTSAGTKMTATVASGVLKITTGSAATLGTAITVKEVDTWTDGTAPSLGTAFSIGSASNGVAGAWPTLNSTPRDVVVPS